MLPGSRGLAVDAAAPAGTDRGVLFTALNEQLGLRLKAARGPVDTLEVERVERPTDD